mmetsp:Transcript_16363/g.40322  ORF Transcript_16363/g.40322 Transcript_16363/m.40322 type:complete len:215 (+) Transcript_16363:1581-2225(+)
MSAFVFHPPPQSRRQLRSSLRSSTPLRMSQGRGLRPKLLVFDLDGTLWYPEMYQLWGGGAPFTRRADGDVTDCNGQRVRMMGNSRALLKQVLESEDWKGTGIAVSSRTDEPGWAQECMRKIVIVPGQDAVTLKDCIGHEEISKVSKDKHMRSLKQRTGVDFEDMLFFDNEIGNCRRVEPLGVHCVYVPDGMTAASWSSALHDFADRRAAQRANK